MAIDPARAGDLVGRTYPATAAYEVGREHIRSFAAALGADDPAYTDRDAAAALGHPDVIAPPTFAFAVAQPALEPLTADLGVDLANVVHGDQRFSYARPIRAGDVLRASATIEKLRTMAGNDVLSTRTDLVAADGEHVCSSYATIVVRAPQDGPQEGEA